MNLSKNIKSQIFTVGLLLCMIQQISAITCKSVGGTGGCVEYCQNSDRDCANGSCDNDDYCHCWDCQGDLL